MDRQEDNLAQMPMWKSYLYHLQQQAPKPKRIQCQREIPNKPPQYGKEYHGAISREDADFMLTIGGEGSFLIRESQRAPGQYTLAIRFDGVTKNFKLYFDNQHYVGEKRFDTVQDLVADGLITFYLESKAADYIAALSSQSNYAESPYVAYNTQKKWQMAASGPRRLPRPGMASQVATHPETPRTAITAASVVSGDAAAGTGGSRSSSETETNAGTAGSGSGSADSAAGQSSVSRAMRGAHLPVEKTRLSHIAESWRPQEGQKTPCKISHPDKSLHQSVPGTPQMSKQQSRFGQVPSRSNASVTAGVTEIVQPDGRVTSSTNTEGPMLEEAQFSTPPSSPPLGMQVLEMGKQLYGKASSVTWCNDYLDVMGCEKPHNFRLYTFKGPHWCDYCANFLWGLIAQGVKCQDCGFNAHKKCSEKVPNDCMPDMKYVKRMFGIDLTTLVKAQNTLIPVVVELCIKEIEARGVESEGLYRVAGFHDDVEAIKMSFDKDAEQTDISEEHYDDLNTIASVLKLYFRLLPIPLITFDIYFKVIDIVRRDDVTAERKFDMIKHCLAILPPAHYHTLKYLMAHLHRVAEHQQQNMMSAENLAIVFAPTLLRSPETDPLFSLSAVKYERELIEILILHHSQLFD